MILGGLSVLSFEHEMANKLRANSKDVSFILG